MVWVNPINPASQSYEDERPEKRIQASKPTIHPEVSRIKSSVQKESRQMGSWADPLVKILTYIFPMADLAKM